MKFDSLIDVVQYFSDEKRCIDYFIQMRWKGTPACIYCNCTKLYEITGKNRGYKCSNKECRKSFSIIKSTIAENSQIPLHKWLIGMWLYSFHKKGISSCQLGKDLHITQKAAWFMSHRIRYMLKTKSMEVLEGEIMLDETFVGGKNKNRPYHKKVKNSQGRAFIDKTPVLGMLEKEEAHYIERPHKVRAGKTVKEKVVTKESKLIAKVVKNTQGKTLQPIIKETVKKGSKLVSDEWVAYQGLNSEYEHHYVDHSRSQYVDEAGNSTNTLEGAWTQLKMTVTATYHQVSRKHLQRYVDEFSYRYNTRKIKVQDILDDAMKNINCRLTYKELIKLRA